VGASIANKQKKDFKLMPQSNPLQNSSSTEIEKTSQIHITKKTLRFGNSVYQFHNVTGFKVGQVKTGLLFPMKTLLIAFLIGLVLANIDGAKLLGILILLGAIAGIIANLTQPKVYGLQLELNSGGSKLFPTTDLEGLRKIIALIYEYMESEKENPYTIYFEDKSIRGVEGNIYNQTGNFGIGHMSGGEVQSDAKVTGSNQQSEKK
jgi:Family of unknown function (DUF6232)